MTSIRWPYLDTRQLDDVFQESLLHLRRNLVELIQVDDQRLAHEQHKSILLSTHDVELALQLSDRLWLMEENRLSIGTPRELAADGSLSRFINRDGIRLNEQKMRIEFETFHNSFHD